MSNVSRKDFLKLSSWALIGALLPFQKISALNSILSNESNGNIGDFKKAQDIAKEAKVLFYKKQYLKAEELYLQCINLAPNSILFYDNLDNVYGAKGDFLSSVELYRNGLIKNPDKVSFYDRSARSLMRLEVGSKKQASVYRNKINSVSLLKDAELLYEKAISKDMSKKYLLIGLNKVKEKIRINAGFSDFKKDINFIKLKKENQSKYKSFFQNLTDEQLEELVNKTEIKKRIQLYSKDELLQQKKHIVNQKKKYYRIILNRNNKDLSKALLYSKKIFDIDNSDPISLNHLKSALYRNKMFSEFIDYRKKFSDKRQTLYAYLGVMDSIEVAFIKNQVDYQMIDEAISIGEDLINSWPLTESLEVDVVNKLSKLYIIKKDFITCKHLLKRTIDRMSITTPAVINKLTYSYASCFLKEGSLNDAKNILLTSLKKISEQDMIFPEITRITSIKIQETNRDKIILLYLLYDVFIALNNVEEAKNVLNELYSFNSKDKFVLNRK